MGYLFLDVEVEGEVLPGCAILILKNTPSTVEQRRSAPGLLGTNVLARIPRFAEMMAVPAGGGGNSLGCRSGFARVAGMREQLVPSGSVVSVPVTGPACRVSALVEGLTTGVPGNLQLANTLVDATKTCYLIQVKNHTTKEMDGWDGLQHIKNVQSGATTACSRERRGDSVLFPEGRQPRDKRLGNWLVHGSTARTRTFQWRHL